MPRYATITADDARQGDTYDLQLDIDQENGDPFDLTDYTLTARLRPAASGTTIYQRTLTLPDAPGGVAALSLSSPETEVLSGAYEIEVEAEYPNGDVRTWLIIKQTFTSQFADATT